MTTAVQALAMSADEREFFIQFTSEEPVAGLYDLCSRSRFNFDVIAIYAKAATGDFDCDFTIGGVQIGGITGDNLPDDIVNTDGSIAVDSSALMTFTVDQDSSESQRMIKDSDSNPLQVNVVENVTGTRLNIIVWCRKLQDQSVTAGDDPS